MDPSAPVPSLGQLAAEAPAQVSQHQMSPPFCLQGRWNPQFHSKAACPQALSASVPLPHQPGVSEAGHLLPPSTLTSTFHPAARMIALKHKCGHKTICSPQCPQRPINVLTAAPPALSLTPPHLQSCLLPLMFLHPPQVLLLTPRRTAKTQPLSETCHDPINVGPGKISH